MAVVWLARDLKHERRVAIKVLRPELSALIGAERFRREIRVMAALQHPHILPLHDSGESAGLLFYVMPFVEGESLRDRLGREGALPAGEALRLAGEIGDGLSHAHRHGVVHRDVKPENVLLADGHALVADFGIARSGGAERLTETGMSLGTPAYMSPEQGSGDEADARSDQYALAALTYEMLAGEPPFTGPTAQSVIAKHMAQPAPSVRMTRPAIPAHVDAALQRALAKQPADRFASVTDFVDALRHAPTAVLPATGRPAPGDPRRGRRAALIGLVVALVLAALGTRWLAARRGGAPAGDPDAVAVLPFRTDGADPALAYLGEGMVDLVAVKLPGGGGARAIAPRAALAAWRSELARGGDDPARAVARRLGAGLVLDGSVVGSASRVTLNATLRDAASGGMVGTGEVSGPGDSLPTLVDRLVIALLARRSGVTPQQLAGLTSLQALREYLAGLAAHRQARYADAVQHFDAALREDSTFALAALAAVPSSWRLGDGPGPEYRERAFRMRRRLHGADSIMLRAMVGDTFPSTATMLEDIAGWEQAVAAVPDRAEGWFELGDRQLHWGLLSDYPDALARARRSFERALALDSSYAIAIDHLLMLALHDRDSAAAARLAPLYRRTGSRGDRARAFDWILATMLRDSAALREVRARLPSMPRPSLEWLSAMPMLEAGDGDISVRAVAQLVRDASTKTEVRTAAVRERGVALNVGHPRLAEDAMRRAVEAGASPVMTDFVRVVAASYWDGDAAAGAAALRRLSEAGGDPALPMQDAPGWWACATGLKGIADQDVHAVGAAAARVHDLLRRTASPDTDDNRRLCVAVLEAALAVSARRADQRERFRYADSLYVYSPVQTYWYYGLVMSRLQAAAGDAQEALRMLRRRAVAVEGPNEVALLSSILRDEGQLAEATGDRAGAIRAYEHYLGLRADPDPALRPARDSVRMSLAALLGEPRPDIPPR